MDITGTKVEVNTSMECTQEAWDKIWENTVEDGGDDESQSN